MTRGLGRGRRGVALPIVIWALVAIGALAAAAILAARVDRVLAAHHRHHAAALAHAEAGLAEALAAMALDPTRGLRADSVSGALGAGGWRADWTVAAGGLRIRGAGWSGPARRTVEARVMRDGAGALRVTAWREVL